MFLYGHVDGIVIQPEGILLAESVKCCKACRIPLFHKDRIGLVQKELFEMEQMCIIKEFLLVKESGIHVICFHKPFCYEGGNIYEQGIARKGGIGLIWRIPEPGRSYGQYLPVGLTRLFQEIYEFIAFLSKGAYAVG